MEEWLQDVGLLLSNACTQTTTKMDSLTGTYYKLMDLFNPANNMICNPNLFLGISFQS